MRFFSLFILIIFFIVPESTFSQNLLVIKKKDGIIGGSCKTYKESINSLYYTYPDIYIYSPYSPGDPNSPMNCEEQFALTVEHDNLLFDFEVVSLRNLEYFGTHDDPNNLPCARPQYVYILRNNLSGDYTFGDICNQRYGASITINYEFYLFHNFEFLHWGNSNCLEICDDNEVEEPGRIHSAVISNKCCKNFENLEPVIGDGNGNNNNSSKAIFINGIEFNYLTNLIPSSVKGMNVKVFDIYGQEFLIESDGNDLKINNLARGIYSISWIFNQKYSSRTFKIE